MKRALLLLLFIISNVHAQEPISIIYVIGDGMGAAYTSAYRYYADNPDSSLLDPTIFDQLLVGSATTYPADHALITDSAAAATALAAGVKTINGAIGVDAQGKPVETLLERAKRHGYQTAVVVTSAVNHATPASFIAHVNSRQSYQKIADSYLDQTINGRLKVDLMLGGGRQYFIRKDRNLVKEFEKKGYRYLNTFDELDALESLPALGLFADDGLEFALNSDNPLRLARMTEKSLSLLGKKPFFLLVEASQIDWCGHSNDVACAMAEMRDLDATLLLLKKYIDKHPNTIMLATADHSTGGLSLGSQRNYFLDVAAVKKIQLTGNALVRKLLSNRDKWQSEWLALTDITLTKSEQAKIQEHIRQLRGEEIKKSANSRWNEFFSALESTILNIIDRRSHTSWTTIGHTGEEVPVFSYGKGSQQFIGSFDNTELAKKLGGYLSP